MRVFISLPMTGRPTESIREELARIQAALAAQGHTTSDGLETEDAGVKVNWPLWCLGSSLRRLAGCDAAYFAEGWQRSKGCAMEHEACLLYDIPILQD